MTLYLVCDGCGHVVGGSIQAAHADAWVAERMAEHETGKMRLVTADEYDDFVVAHTEAE